MTRDGSRFDDLLRLWQDGEASASDLRELESLLRSDPACRRELVECSLLEAGLYRRYAASAPAPARQPARRRSWEAAAALLVFAVSAFLMGRLFLRGDEASHRLASGEVWIDGARSSTLTEGRAFEVRGDAPARVALADGSLAVLSPGSAGILRNARDLELSRGGGSFALRGAHRISTPAGSLSSADAELQLLLRKTPRELVVDVSRGSAHVESLGRMETVSAGSRRTFGPLPPPGGIDYAKLLDGAAFGLAEAIDRAAALAPGVPLHAALENEEGRTVYSIAIALDGKVREIDIDAKTGKVLENDTDDENRSQLAAALKVPLRAAVAKALATVPGRAVEAEAELKNGRARYEIKILGDEGVVEVKVDGETGEVRSERK